MNVGCLMKEEGPTKKDIKNGWLVMMFVAFFLPLLLFPFLLTYFISLMM